MLTVATLAVTNPSRDAFLVLGVVAIVAIGACWTTWLPGSGPSMSIVAEGVLSTAAVCAFLPDTRAGLAYLVVPLLAAGLTDGAVLIAPTWLAQTVTAIAASVLVVNNSAVGAGVAGVAPWLLTALGVGALGAWVRQTREAPAPEADAYGAAHRLLSELRTVARQLSAGLDPVGIAQQVLADVHEVVGDDASVVVVKSGGGSLMPLATRGADTLSTIDIDDAMVMECWTHEAPAQETAVVDGRSVVRLALPLLVGVRMIAVVVLLRPTTPDPETMREVQDSLRRHALHLDTAMVFDEVRSLATIDERRRLAREIHDGIAQEVASLGYAVDSLLTETATPAQREGLASLRDQLTHLVSELRLSIFDLRSEVTPNATLGSVLADYVHQVSAQTGMTVHLSLNETPQRLRIEVETEILRIAQEAITNARRHSGASHLWVTFSADPPQATLSITDDGTGLGDPRHDSFGLKIMRERAERIGADLAVVSEPERGTSVALTLTAATALRRDDPSADDHRKEAVDAHVGPAHR